MALDEIVQEKVAFAGHVGLFQFKVILFGLVNALGILQQLMSTVLSEREGFTMAYLDDILAKVETAKVLVPERRDNVLGFCHR